MKTACEHCVFKTVENGKQTGCYLGKSDFFVKTEENGFFVLDGFCTTCKNVYEYGENKSQEEMKRTLLKEGLKYAIFIDITDKTQPQHVINLMTELRSLRVKPYRIILLANEKCKHLEMYRDLIAKHDETVMINISMRYTGFYTKASEVKHLRATHYYFIKKVPQLGHVIPFLDKVNEDFVLRQQAPTIIKVDRNHFVNKVLFERYKYHEHPMTEIIRYVQSNSNNSKPQQ